MVILPKGLFGFQEKCVKYLLNTTLGPSGKQTIVVKAPTGSGKTVMLIDFIDKYLSARPKTAFIWLCPGQGDLEEQSRGKMKRFCPNRSTRNLYDSLTAGFEAGTTTFINWELVTKKGNNALKDSERQNLFERIEEARRAGTSFVVLIDEEHSNKTSKAASIIEAFSAVHMIRVSATTTRNKNFDYYEVDEQEVIDEGLITRVISVNEGITMDSAADDSRLIELADEKRTQIAEAYQKLGKTIRPLVLIQFPSGQPERIAAVERRLEAMGYTYENGMVAKWMSEDKRDLTADIMENSGIPIFLLMKQAISVGWDCPRAKILVKLREGGNENFQIQTIGRIRRMPEHHHYEVPELDQCYVYTFDEKYKAGLLSEIDKAYETRLLTLREDLRSFTLTKEMRGLDSGGLSERELFTVIKGYYVRTYGLTEDKEGNRRKLREPGENMGGYRFAAELLGMTLTGEYARIDSLAMENRENQVRTRTEVDTHEHGILLLHIVDELKTILGTRTAVVKAVLDRLFRNKGDRKHKLLALDTKDFYAFVINNGDNLRRDFRQIAAIVVDQQEKMSVSVKKAVFSMPEQDFYHYDASVKGEKLYQTNAYKGYTSGYATLQVRSRPEQLFEQHCEREAGRIDWVYKNGNSGRQYFSICYWTAPNKQRLFYPDYIVRKKDGSIWILEIKGGETAGRDNNRDLQAENKFNALKIYAGLYDLNWGFVRDRDSLLYICNTEYTEELGDNWVSIEDVF